MARPTTWLIIPDMHVPYHCERYFNLLLIIIAKLGDNLAGIIQLGDALDFWQLSIFDKDPSRKEGIVDDMNDYKKLLHTLERHVPKGTHFYQLEGNHEDRLRRYVWRSAPAIAKLVPSVPSFLGFDSRTRMNYKWFPLATWNACVVGNVVLHHGHFFNKHVAVGNLSRYPTNFISGHTHRFQYATDGTRFSVSLGHAADTVRVMHIPVPSEWQQCVGVLTVTDKTTALEPVMVTNGICVFRGEQIVVR